MKVSIKDVARKAGVSNATVSLVLNGKGKEGRISKVVAERVRRIAAELNYQPNILAKSLQSGKTFTIGLIVADISNPFFSQLAYYIQDQIEKSGYTVMIMNTNENDEHMGKIIDVLKNHQVDGYIIVPTEHGEGYIRSLIEARYPVVLLDRFYPELPTVSVMVDSYQASFLATKLLIEKGCKKIGFMVYKSTQSNMTERKYGYLNALEQSGLDLSDYVEYVDFQNLEADIHDAVYSLLSKDVDGILLATNTISLIAIRVLLENCIRIQNKIKIVSFDKSEAFEFMADPIPYIRQPIEEMGRKAADLLLEQMEKKKFEKQVFKYPATLIRRDF